MEDPDREVVVAWKRAHFQREEATQEIEQRYSRRVVAYFTRKSFDRDEVEALTQTTFANVFKGLADYRGDTRFAAWLFKVAENVYVNRIRHLQTVAGRGRKSETPLDDLILSGWEPPFASPSPEQLLLDEESAAALRSAIRDLPPAMRRVLEMTIHHGLKIAEVAAAIGRSEGTVKAHLYQARIRLKEKLGKYFSDAGFPDEESERGD
jgi:RNA polymerase sigma factor (sigma-70 family)